MLLSAWSARLFLWNIFWCPGQSLFSDRQFGLPRWILLLCIWWSSPLLQAFGPWMRNSSERRSLELCRRVPADNYVFFRLQKLQCPSGLSCIRAAAVLKYRLRMMRIEAEDCFQAKVSIRSLCWWQSEIRMRKQAGRNISPLNSQETLHAQYLPLHNCLQSEGWPPYANCPQEHLRLLLLAWQCHMWHWMWLHEIYLSECWLLDWRSLKMLPRINSTLKMNRWTWTSPSSNMALFWYMKNSCCNILCSSPIRQLMKRMWIFHKAPVCLKLIPIGAQMQLPAEGLFQGCR